jgi:prepilin-type N-terminal cleavage/methylation domain-containing protein
MKKGFTIIELLIVMAVIAILVGIGIPSFRAMQTEAWKTKAQGEVRVLRLAIEAYYKNHGSLPADEATYQATLLSESPAMLESNLYDPFGATSTTQYIFKKAGSYYVVYSVGSGGNGAMTVSSGGSAEATTGNPIYATNAR